MAPNDAWQTHSPKIFTDVAADSYGHSQMFQDPSKGMHAHLQIFVGIYRTDEVGLGPGRAVSRFAAQLGQRLADTRLLDLRLPS